MKLIIGLGNPGKQYQNTRHNVGFIMVDMFFSTWKEDKKSKSLISQDFKIRTSQPQVIGIKPQTFMNLSGDTISALISFYKIDPKKDILVISDDIDMEFGKVRFRSEGSHGGQNGLRDIIIKIGTNEFSRIKIGIGRDERYNVADWVLSRFTIEERDLIEIEARNTVEKYIIKWLCD